MVAATELSHRLQSPVRISHTALQSQRPVPALEFGAVEAALSRAHVDRIGHLVLDAATGDAVGAAAEQLPLPLSAVGWNHVEYLIGRAFPAAAAEQLRSLLHTYQAYRLALPASDSRFPATIQQEVDRLAEIERLQDAHFGAALAEVLFGRARALNRHILDLRLLEEDPALSDEERRMRAAVLAEEYQRRAQEAL